MRKTIFENGEHYHIYNRGVEKRDLYSNDWDIKRFLQSMEEFNINDPLGSIYENSFRKERKGSMTFGNSTPKSEPLVSFVAYCLNPNHYHFILEQIADKGIQKFMHKLATGYTNYFNEKYKRTGALFQGRYKAIHINNNGYLLHLSAYVNLNDHVHQLGSSTPKLENVQKSSWAEYIGESSKNFCKKEIVLGQFKDGNEYETFAKDALESIRERKEELLGLHELFFD